MFCEELQNPRPVPFQSLNFQNTGSTHALLDIVLKVLQNYFSLFPQRKLIIQKDLFHHKRRMFSQLSKRERERERENEDIGAGL